MWSFSCTLYKALSCAWVLVGAETGIPRNCRISSAMSLRDCRLGGVLNSWVSSYATALVVSVSVGTKISSHGEGSFGSCGLSFCAVIAAYTAAAKASALSPGC